jgi:hypothetical protein
MSVWLLVDILEELWVVLGFAVLLGQLLLLLPLLPLLVPPVLLPPLVLLLLLQESVGRLPVVVLRMVVLLRVFVGSSIRRVSARAKEDLLLVVSGTT